MKRRIAIKVAKRALAGGAVRAETWKRMVRRLTPIELRYLMWNVMWPSAWRDEL